VSASDANASASDALVIEVRADDGPKGSGVRGVEYQLDSTLGSWRPLSLDSRSMTYKATWKPVGVAEGSHELYVRATDNTGNSRKAHVTVKVTHAPAPSNEVREPVPSDEANMDLTWNGLGPATLAASGPQPRGCPEPQRHCTDRKVFPDCARRP
jgi:hypothetical protein